MLWERRRERKDQHFHSFFFFFLFFWRTWLSILKKKNVNRHDPWTCDCPAGGEFVGCVVALLPLRADLKINKGPFLYWCLLNYTVVSVSACFRKSHKYCFETRWTLVIACTFSAQPRIRLNTAVPRGVLTGAFIGWVVKEDCEFHDCQGSAAGLLAKQGGWWTYHVTKGA